MNSSKLRLIFTDILCCMGHRTSTPKKAERCAYIKACYLAEELNCFGYKTDCPLYQKSNGEVYNEDRFNEAMDQLINKTLAKYQSIPK